MVSAFDGCTDSCGWTAAFIAALAYGSFGVPIKETKDIDVHPLVLQSYKTFVMFVACWGVTFLGVEVGFTKWGLLSGLLWVLGGTGGIYGIRMAGLAIAVGTWASIMIMVNLIFGILVFREPVHDLWGTICSFLLLILGLVGMSHYSEPQPKENSNDIQDPADELEDPLNRRADPQSYYELHDDTLAVEAKFEDENTAVGENSTTNNDGDHQAHIVLFSGRLSLTKRQCGILGAAMNGVLTGGSLIPLHYAKEEGLGGANYIISMSTGAFTANILIWTAFFLFNAIISRSRDNMGLLEVYQRMPEWHFRVLWLPGLLAGILLTTAMFGSILAVTYLGQGVGNSLVQTKILVSGLWGIFWYKEITGNMTILKWFGSAGIALLAIIWLSLERLLSTGEDH